MAISVHEASTVRYFAFHGFMACGTFVALNYSRNPYENDIGLCLGPQGATAEFLRDLGSVLNLKVIIDTEATRLFRMMPDLPPAQRNAMISRIQGLPRVEVIGRAADGIPGLERLGRMAQLVIDMLDRPDRFWNRIQIAPEFQNAFNAYINRLQELGVIGPDGVNPNDRRIPAFLPFPAAAHDQ